MQFILEPSEFYSVKDLLVWSAKKGLNKLTEYGYDLALNQSCSAEHRRIVNLLDRQEYKVEMLQNAQTLSEVKQIEFLFSA